MDPVVAVIGAGECDASLFKLAREVGRRLAEAGCIVVSGGLGGVMEAASRGASEAGGLVVGIVPGADPSAANEHVTLAVATGMGDARNAILANTAAGFIAVGGSYGTLTEIAFALKRRKPVVALESWDVDPAVRRATTAEEAVSILLAAL
jgi:uncharacterized protein (TIGR00725 family)